MYQKHFHRDGEAVTALHKEMVGCSPQHCMKIWHAYMFQKGDLKVEQEQRCGIHDATEDYVLNLQK